MAKNDVSILLKPTYRPPAPRYALGAKPPAGANGQSASGGTTAPLGGLQALRVIQPSGKLTASNLQIVLNLLANLQALLKALVPDAQASNVNATDPFDVLKAAADAFKPPTTAASAPSAPTSSTAPSSTAPSSVSTSPVGSSTLPGGLKVTVAPDQTVQVGVVTDLKGFGVSTDSGFGLVTLIVQGHNGTIAFGTDPATQDRQNQRILTGTIADVNAQLKTLNYESLDQGAPSITVAVYSGGDLASSPTFTTHLTNAGSTPVTPPPVTPPVTAPLAVSSGQTITGGQTVSLSDLSSPFDGDTFSGVRVFKLQASSGVLNTTAAGNAAITGVGGDILTIKGTSDEIKDTLKSVTFTGTVAGPVTIESNFVGISLSKIRDISLTVAPTATVSATNPLEVKSASSNYYIEEALTIGKDTALKGFAVKDNGTTGPITATLYAINATTSLTAAGNATVTDAVENGQAVKVISGTAADINATLDSLKVNAAAIPGNKYQDGGGTITLKATDGTNVVSAVAVIYGNAEGESVRGHTINAATAFSQTVQAGVTTNLSGFAVNERTDNGGQVVATLNATNGTIGAATRTDPRSNHLVIQGTLSEVNEALKTLNFQGTSAGAASVSLSVTGNGSVAQGSFTTKLTVEGTSAPVATPPTTIYSGQTIAGGTTATVIGAFTDLGASGNFTGVRTLRVLGSSGILNATASGNAGITGAGGNVLTITGTSAEISATLKTLTFTGNVSGTNTFTGNIQATAKLERDFIGVSTGVFGTAYFNVSPTATTNPVNPIQVKSASSNIYVEQQLNIGEATALKGFAVKDTGAATPITATLYSTNASTSLVAAGNATVTDGIEKGRAVKIITGSAADVNATLDSLKVTPSGASLLTNKFTDGGGTITLKATDGTNVASASATIYAAPNGEAIRGGTIDAAAAFDQTIQKGVVSDLSGFAVNETHDTGAQVTATLTATNGTLALGSGVRSGQLVIQGTLTEVNEKLKSLTVQGTKAGSAAVTLSLKTADFNVFEQTNFTTNLNVV